MPFQANLMTEQILLNYFKNIATVEELSADLKDSHKKTSYDTVTIFVKPLDHAIDFTVTKDHLLMLCNDMLNDNKISVHTKPSRKNKEKCPNNKT